MACFLRCLTLCIFMLAGSAAHAQYTTDPYNALWRASNGACSTGSRDLNALIACYVPNGWQPTYTVSFKSISFGSGGATGTFKVNLFYGGSIVGEQSKGIVRVSVCPVGTVAQGTACVTPPPPPPQCDGEGQYEITGGVCGCRFGYDQQPDGSCVSNCSAAMNETITLFSAEGAARGCMLGCEYSRAAVPGGSSCSLHMEMNGDGGPQRSCEYRATGANCTGTENPTPADPGDPPPDPTTPPGEDEPAPLPPAPCPVGSSGGTINGVEVCLPAPITDREGTVTRVEEHPDGSTTETTTTIKDRVNDDGTVSREIVRTITTRDSSGNVTGTTTDRRTEEGSKSGFCEENPNATICGDGNGYGASCGSEFSCSGDAVQCGIAYESHITACAVVADDSVLAEFETIREFDGTGEGEGLDRRTIEVDQLDVSLSGGGAGLTDVSFTVASVTVEIPFSRLNQYLAMIGYAMLAIAWLIAFRIISGAF